MDVVVVAISVTCGISLIIIDLSPWIVYDTSQYIIFHIDVNGMLLQVNGWRSMERQFITPHIGITKVTPYITLLCGEMLYSY